MKTYIHSLIYILIIGFTLQSCNVAKEHYKHGNYSAAVKSAASKIRKDGKKRDKYVLILEQAYKAALDREISRIEYLKKEGQPENFDEIFSRFSKIKDVQEVIRPMLPLYIESEYRNANITLIDIDEEMVDAKFRAASYHYESGIKLLAYGNRHESREAYSAFQKVKSYYADFKDVDVKMQEAFVNGQSHVLIDFTNNSPTAVPQDVISSLLDLEFGDLNGSWVKYHQGRKSDVDFDYHLLVNLSFVDAGRESILEREHIRLKEIQDGYEYLFDDKGNVVKDSLGNDIKEPKYIKIKAIVHETHQEKHATIQGRFDYFDPNTKQLIQSFPFNENLAFTNSFGRFNGDKRALVKDDLSLINGRALTFPSDYQMMMDLSGILKQRLVSTVKNNYSLVMR